MNTAAKEHFIGAGQRLLDQPLLPVAFTDDASANELLNDLRGFPHAFILACFMDRQMPAKKAWLIPHLIRLRLGSFDFSTLATLSEGDCITMFTQPAKLHRYPEKMARCFHSAIQRLRDVYDGDASRLWSDCPNSGELIYRLLQFQEIGQKIATMTANILVRHFHVSLTDKSSIDVSIDGLVPRVLRRVFGLSAKADATELIFFARSLNPAYPGIFDYEAWEIGSTWCQPLNPQCRECRARPVCLHATQASENRP